MPVGRHPKTAVQLVAESRSTGSVGIGSEATASVGWAGGIAGGAMFTQDGFRGIVLATVGDEGQGHGPH